MQNIVMRRGTKKQEREHNDGPKPHVPNKNNFDLIRILALRATYAGYYTCRF